jgi:hypothetical protein
MAYPLIHAMTGGLRLMGVARRGNINQKGIPVGDAFLVVMYGRELFAGSDSA